MFSGRSGPRLIVQVVRFRFYFGASVLSCVLLAACAAMRDLVLYAHILTQKWHTCPAMHKLGPYAHFPGKTIPLGCKSYSQLGWVVSMLDCTASAEPCKWGHPHRTTLPQFEIGHLETGCLTLGCEGRSGATLAC